MFDLLDIPDDQLSPDQLIKKKRQYILQKAKEGRAKAQAQQREKRQKVCTCVLCVAYDKKICSKLKIKIFVTSYSKNVQFHFKYCFNKYVS